jgi:hypothetical protein
MGEARDGGSCSCGRRADAEAVRECGGGGVRGGLWGGGVGCSRRLVVEECSVTARLHYEMMKWREIVNSL